jgi:hypothetical protein
MMDRRKFLQLIVGLTVPFPSSKAFVNKNELLPEKYLPQEIVRKMESETPVFLRKLSPFGKLEKGTI